MGYNLTELSMGMTSDFEIAIEEGATMIRIGSQQSLVDRDYSKDWRQVMKISPIEITTAGIRKINAWI
ncbi:MAG: hypothetical protein MZV64_01185 [Ignavibacteriales bacterium]|nr:hypothetical protein [Ignavibacteriales bacterium]